MSTLDWADPLTLNAAGVVGLGDDEGMGSWLSKLINRNKETISKVTGVVSAVAGSIPNPVTQAIAAGASIVNSILPTSSPPPADPPAAPPPAAAATAPNYTPLLLGAGALLLLSKR